MYNYWWRIYYICYSVLNSCIFLRPYLWVYYWYNYPVFNVFKLCSYWCSLSLNPLQLFKVIYMTCNLFMNTYTQKTNSRTNHTAGQFLLIIWQLNNIGIYLYLVLHIIGRDVIGRTNFTCIQLHIFHVSNSTLILPGFNCHQ